MSVFDDDDSQPFDAQAVVNDIYSSVDFAPGSNDAADLAAKNPEDRAQFIADLTAQRDRRAAPTDRAPDGVRPAPSSRFGESAPASIAPFGEVFTGADVGNLDSTAGKGFQFRLGEALKAIRRQGAGRGLSGTNRVWQALQDQATGMADSFYNEDFGRELAGYTTRRDTHMGNEQARYGSQRSNRLDDFGIFTDARNFDRSVLVDDRNFNRGVVERDRDFGRTLTNDAWGRGADLWNMNRTDQNDAFTQNLSLEELRRRYAPRPA